MSDRGAGAAYRDAAAVFGQVISALDDAEWELPSGPEGWTVLGTVASVVVGDAQITAAVDGEPVQVIGDIDAGVLGTNPVATWRGTALAVMRALDQRDALRARFDSPSGSVLVADMVAQRVTENLVRAWDIGRAAERPVELAPDLAEWCLDFWADRAGSALRAGVLMPVEPPDGAEAVARFLALTGRTG